MTEPKKTAGGLPAIQSTLSYAHRQMGVTRSVQTLLRVNQKQGFDCPGCAWPDPDDRRAMVEFCENGAKAVADEATRKRIEADFFARYAIPQLLAKPESWLNQQGRLCHPMFKAKGSAHYTPLSWQEAFDFIAQQLKSLASPDEAIFYTSGRTSNEAAFLFQLFVRLFGTNNLPDCSNMCHESSGVALKEVIGVGKGTVTLDDFDHADCIFVVGQNPGSNHPRMLTALQKAARKGAKIISMNPLPETGLNHFAHPQYPWEWVGSGTQLACLHLPVRINGDVAALKGILKTLLASEDFLAQRQDDAFIATSTQGFAAFKADMEDTSWESICEESGLSREQIQAAAQIIGTAKTLITCWAMGLTQHKNAIANIQEIVNLHLLGGHFGRKGSGVCPVRGHSNVQGDRTMGIYTHPSTEFLAKLGAAFDFTPPQEAGLDTIAAIQGMHAGRVKVFIAMGGNFLSASPDTEFTGEALRRSQLSVQISTKLNRSHLITGESALILPCLGRTEIDVQASGPQFITVENSMGVVSKSQGTLKVASPFLKSEVAIVAGLAQATFGKNAYPALDWEALTANYDIIREGIARVIPGFEDCKARLQTDGSFYLPNLVKDERRFATVSGKGQFTVHPILRSHYAADEFLLMTIRSHDQYNTTVYAMNDRYRGIRGDRRVILIHKDDIQDFAWEEGMLVDVTSHFESTTRTLYGFKLVAYPIPRRCLAGYFPECNPLVPLESISDKSRTPTYKSIVVKLSRSQEGEASYGTS